MRQETKLDKIVYRLERFSLSVAALLLAVTVFSSFIQVISRTVIGKPLTWTEELARFCGIWMIMWAMGPIFRERGHIGVDFLYNKFPKVAKKYVDIVNDCITILTMLAFTIYAAVLMINGSGTSSPALRFPMSIIYAGVFLGGALSVFFATYAAVNHTKANFAKTGLEKEEST